mgnify:CR=1 FL=1
MDALFLTVLNMSLTASYVIIFVIVIRLFLKKFPKVYSYALWFAVLFRLICPFSFDSIFSLIPKNVNIPQDIVYSPKPEINSGIIIIDSAVNNVLPPPVNSAASVNPMQIWIAIGEAVWLIGIAILLVYSVFTTVKLYRKLRNAKHMEDNIYIVNEFKTPFVFGIVNPKIYLPDHLSENEKSYVLLHEQTHIKRLDFIVKLIFFIFACIHWFNPIVWISFYLMGEDMELSCDEKVVKQMGSSIKKEYSSSLLTMSTGRRILGGSPIAFGENNTEGRIKNILNYKKPKLWVIVLLIIIVTAVGVGLMTNPKNDQFVSENMPKEISSAEELWEARTKYIGDNSAVGKLISLLPVPEDLQYDHFELHTGEQPYYIEIVYSASSEVLKRYDTVEAVKLNPFRKNALILLALVDNANSVRAVITDGKREVGFNNGREWADYTVGENVWNYAESPEKLQELINMPLTASSSNKDKINDYLIEKSINTFSLYYELLNFIISDYHEEVVDGNVEAIFSYTIVHKNYDRDPDTVQYIKEAKERGDENYQTYYDEYLQPQDMNFYFKAVVDENDTITLYSKNPAIINDEWQQVEMSDYVIGKITEEHESEKRNRNEPVENDIAGYISYDYEYRSIYIAGLKIFEEFGTVEFGYANEGSARIINDENAMEFFITVSTGLVPGAGTVTGPGVYFKMALDTYEIVEKELSPAPNYAEIAKLSSEHINPDSVQYSEKTIELSDERIVEIGVYITEFILEIESKLD